MNKKNLSVVMAGAMLATSVAPVLAETTTDSTVYTVNKGNIGLLIDKLDTLFASVPKYTTGTYENQSVYGFQIRKVGETVWSRTYADATNKLGAKEDTTKKGNADTSELKKLVNDTTNEFELRVIDRGYVEKDGVVSNTTTVQSYDKYTLEEIQALATEVDSKTGNTYQSGGINTSSLTKGLQQISTLYNYDGNSDATGTKRVITKIEALKDGSTTKGVKITIKGNKTPIELLPGMEELNFNAPISTDSSVKTAADAVVSETTAKSVTGFKPLNTVVKETKPIESKVLYTVKIVNGDVKVEYKVSDLYDGLMLTTEGHNLLTEINTIRNKSDKTKYSVEIEKEGLNVLNNEFYIKIKNNNVTKFVTIKGTSSEENRINVLKDWLEAGKANVDILAGENRYATAVEIAKTYVATEHQYLPEENDRNEGQPTEFDTIVMVNGKALVDGLAAAPYAHVKKAPMLLTADSALPKETKDYLKELVADYKVGSLPEVHIIGGEAVVSNAVVEQLKDMGFKVRRIAGDNREETSLAVADKVREANGNSYEKAFVVGAEGEADAMSIASHAAATETPIIVSKSTKGLSTVGLNEAGNYDKIDIIGGETAVSKADEEALKELLDNEDDVTRIAGANRFETNAEVIKTYHKNNFSNVIVSKDGQNKNGQDNKDHLVDALAVSIFASSIEKTEGTAAPIVLATDKVTDAQINEVVKYSNKDKGTTTMSGTLYQVGGGVNTENVMKRLADKLGLLR